MSFDEFLAKRGYIRGYKHDYQTAYDYGVESQQQEIEKLQCDIDKLQAELEVLQGMYNAVSLTAGELIDERDALQKRIDKSIFILSAIDTNEEAYKAIDLLMRELKGKV